MKDVFALFMVILTIYGCKADKFTSGDFEGKTFTAKLVSDESLISGNITPDIAGIPKMEYIFNKDNKAILRGIVGTTATDYPVKWQVENDSLVIATFTKDGSIRSRRWLISKTTSGYLINNGRNKVELSPN